jgi:hypothetical protein
MKTKVRTELLNNKILDRGKNTLPLVNHVENSFMKTGKEKE